MEKLCGSGFVNPSHTCSNLSYGYVTAASNSKDSQHKQRRFSPDNDPPETPYTSENCLLQKSSNQTIAVNYIINSGICMSSCINIQHPNRFSALMAPGVSQQSKAQMTVLNAKHLGGNWKNLTNQHQYVHTGNNVSADHMQQEMEHGNMEPVVLTPVQNIILQQGVCVPKERLQQKCVSQKAIAVVTPLTQQVMTGDLHSNTLTQEKKGLEHKSASCEKGQEHCIPHLLPIRTTMCGFKSLHNEAQANISQISLSESIKTCGFAQNEEAIRQAGLKECSNQNERLCSVSLNSISGATKGKTQSSHMVHQSRALHENVPVINKEFEDTETRTGMTLPNKLTAIPITEWSLQSLHTLIRDLELIQIKHLKDLPFSNVKSEILKLFWNGDYNQLCEVSKTNIYHDIMNEVRIHSETKDSVILREIPKEKLNNIAPDLQILKHDSTPPKMVYKSSWLNLNGKLDDIDKEYGYQPSVTSRRKPRIEEVIVQEQKRLEEVANEKANGISKLREDAEQSKQLASGHENMSNVTTDKVLKKPESMDVRNETNCLRETKGQERANLPQSTSADKSRNVTMERAPPEKMIETSGKNAETSSEMSSGFGTHFPVSLSKKSVAVSDHCTTIKQGFQHLTPEMTEPSVEGDIADNQDFSTDVKINALSPEKAKKLFFGDPNEEAVTMQTLSDVKTGTATLAVEKYNQSEGEKYTKTEIRIQSQTQLEEYCCMAKLFKSLGYRHGGHCLCVTKAVLSHTSDRNVNEADTCNYRRMWNNRFPCPDDDSMDEIEKVEFISNYDQVLKLANAVSEQLMDAPLESCQSQEFAKNRKHFNDANGRKKKYGTSFGQCLSNTFSSHSICNVNPAFDEKGRKSTKPESKMEEKVINLALYGTSLQKAYEPMTMNNFPMKRLSETVFSDNVPPPPRTLNIKLRSDQTGSLDTHTKSCVPSNSVPFKRRPKMLKCTKRHESKTISEANPDKAASAFDMIRGLLSNGEDQQTSESVNYKNTVSLASADQQKITDGRTMKNRHSTQQGKRRRRSLKKQKWPLALFNRTRRQNRGNDRSVGLMSSFKQTHASSLSKGDKVNKGLTLNFKVLPESFNLPGCRSSVETQPPSSTDTGSKTSALLKRPWGPSGVWCISPKKKQYFNSTETADFSGSSSTFQEFKKRYQEKKLTLPP